MKARQCNITQLYNALLPDRTGCGRDLSCLQGFDSLQWTSGEYCFPSLEHGSQNAGQKVRQTVTATKPTNGVVDCLYIVVKLPKLLFNFAILINNSIYYELTVHYSL